MPSPNSPTLTFAGIDLPVWEANQATWVGRAIPLAEYSPFDDSNISYPSDSSHLNLPTPRRQPEVEPGVLRWPLGASRWAVFHTVLTTDKLDDVEAAAGNGVPATLTIADGRSQKTIGTSMYLLPPRPLAAGSSIDAEPLWVATLVDKRFYWWFRPVSIEEKPASWADLFSALATALDITIAGDTTIESAYGDPTERWLCNNMPACAVLDAAAEAVGRRIVRRLDGTVRMERPETAWASADTQYRTFWPPSTTLATGILEGTAVAGGRMRASTIARTVPEAVRTVFGRKVGDSVLTGQYAIPIRLDAMSLSGFTDASGVPYPGVPGTAARFTADAYATWATDPPAGDPTNLTQLSSLAVQAAQDWYWWRRGFLDVVWAGVYPWVPGGLEDQIRWSFAEDDVTTRVMREPFFNWNVYGHYPRQLSGGTSRQLWGKVEQILSGQKYVLRQTVASGTYPNYEWVTPANPLVVTGLRADSKDFDENVLPFIPVGQQTQIYPSPTVSGLYEIPAWGGQRKSIVRSLYGVCGHCDASGNIIVSALVQKIGTYARDLRTVRFPTGTPEYNIDLSGPGY